MNRNGFRGDRLTAEHEAAHAVIAMLSGLGVHQVSIAPNQTQQGDGIQGSIVPYIPMLPGPCSATAHVDMYAAGLAWELTNSRSPRQAWASSWGDRRESQHDLVLFLMAVVRVWRMLRRPAVAAAVRDIADTVQARPSGEIYGGTLERILALHVPAFAHRHGPPPWLPTPTARFPGTTENGVTAMAGLTADGER